MSAGIGKTDMARKFIDLTSNTVNWLAALLVVGMFGLIALEVILRNVFSTSTFVLDEFVGYAVSGMAFLALGESLHRRQLISVSLLQALVSPRAWSWMIVLANALAVFVGVMLTWFIGRSVLINYERGTTSSSVAEVPQAFPQAILWLGATIFLLRAVEATWVAFVAAKSPKGP